MQALVRTGLRFGGMLVTCITIIAATEARRVAESVLTGSDWYVWQSNLIPP